MMRRIKKFFKNIMIGGLGVILPVFLICLVFYWIFDLTSDFLRPVGELIGETGILDPLAKTLHINGYEVILAQVLAVILILAVCFVLGLIVSTRIGKFFHKFIESGILMKVPGYRVIREVLDQFFNPQDVPFSSVVLARPYNDEVMLTGFVTDSKDADYITVFIPTGPNPTSGNIFHIPKERVKKIDTPVDVALKSVIGCGAGSFPLLSDYRKAMAKQ